MKPKSIKSLLALALLAPGVLFAQTTAKTTPVGYVTKSLPPSQFTFVGLTTHNAVAASGVIASVASNEVTVTGVNFETALSPNNPSTARYILELQNGTITEVTNWTSAGVLTTADDISSQVNPGTTSFSLRRAATISDIFGAANSAGLTPDSDGDYTSGNDLVYVITGDGLKTIYYYNDGETTGWFDSDGEAADNLPVVYSDGFYVQRVGGNSIDLVISGEIKKAPTSGIIAPNWNFMSSVAPSGLTVGTSGLENFITPDSQGDYLQVDNLYVPVGNTVKIIYYYNDGETTGWFDADGEDATNVPLQGDFLILNRGITKSYTLSVPSFYSNL